MSRETSVSVKENLDRKKNQKKTEENSLLKSNLCIKPVLSEIKKYNHHQSITSINEKMREKGQPEFNFHFVSIEKTIKEVALLSDILYFRHTC